MTKAFEEKSPFERLKKSLEEGIRFAKGKSNLRTTSATRRRVRGGSPSKGKTKNKR